LRVEGAKRIGVETAQALFWIKAALTLIGRHLLKDGAARSATA
jgi:hypothetical protein